MWSGTISSAKRLQLNRIRGHIAYSLVELLASAVLVVSIAVLALPTYQDFAPHSEVAEGGVSQAVYIGEESGSVTSEEGINERQPVTGSVGRQNQERPFDPVETPDQG